MHNVVEVRDEDDYEKCRGGSDTSNVAGPHVWQAPAEEGQHFFICGVAVHCSFYFMKAKVRVAASCPP